MQADTSKPANRIPPVPHTKARLPADQAPKTQRIGAKLKVALKAIVWEGQDIAPAAKSAGLTGNALRIALARPHVQRFLREERQVFIAHARAQNIHHAVRLRECGNAMAELGAVKVLEQIGAEQQAAGHAQASPGIVIVIGDTSKTLQSQGKLIDAQAVEVASSPVPVSVGPIANGTD